MGRTFNTDGCCERELNYMVDLSGRLAEIKTMVDGEKYFTINSMMCSVWIFRESVMLTSSLSKVLSPPFPGRY